MEIEKESTNIKPSGKDFRLYLQRELLKRCEKNPSYSLRSFSAALGVNSATLSTMLSGKRTITKAAIQRIGAKLLLGPEEIAAFCEAAAPAAPLNRKPQAVIDYTQLAIDTFAAIADWYHDAILEMTHLKSFKSDPKWIAKVLGISVNEVNIAVERLCRLNLLSVTGQSWKDLSRANEIGTDGIDTSVPLRKYQKQILELSLAALEEVPREYRDHTSTTLTIRQSDITAIKTRIREFRSELAGFIRRNKGQHDQVYQIAVSLFPLTKIETEK